MGSRALVTSIDFAPTLSCCAAGALWFLSEFAARKGLTLAELPPPVPGAARFDACCLARLGRGELFAPVCRECDREATEVATLLPGVEFT